MNWTEIKEDFDTNLLLDGRAFTQQLKKELRGSKDPSLNAWVLLEKWFDYSDMLEITALEPWMFTGDKAIFKGFKKGESADPLVQHRFYTKYVSISFYRPYISIKGKSPVVKVSMYCIKENGWEVYGDQFIETLSHFAELTKDNPIELC